MLLPVVDLITEARLAVDEVIDRAGRGLIETILTLSAEQIAGPKSPGKASGEVRWHGRQAGRVKLAERQLKVERPRLRRKGGGEEAVPAYESTAECLATTNLIESPQSGVRKKTGNVCRWRDGDMTLRWVAGAFLLTEKNFRKIMGYHDLWTLASILGRGTNATSSHQEKVA